MTLRRNEAWIREDLSDEHKEIVTAICRYIDAVLESGQKYFKDSFSSLKDGRIRYEIYKRYTDNDWFIYFYKHPAGSSQQESYSVAVSAYPILITLPQ